MYKLLLSHRHFNRSLKVYSAFQSRKVASDGDIPQAARPVFLNSSRRSNRDISNACGSFWNRLSIDRRTGQLNIFIIRFGRRASRLGINNVMVGDAIEKP